MTVIKVENVSKIYKKDKITAVNEVSFEVRKGEMFGLLGPNGAGKSTMFKMLTTLIHATEGKIGIMGYDPEKNPHEIRTIIGYVAQDGGLDGGLSAYENLRWVAKLYRIPSREIDSRIKAALDAVGLKDIDKRPLGAYSGGMKRSLQIASALLHEPKILFLDEPSVGLDVDHRHNLWEVLRHLNKEKGITIFLTTHYLEEADRICDRVMIIDQGKCVCSGNPQYLKDQVGGDQVHFTLKPHALQLSGEQFRKQLIKERRNFDIHEVQIDDSNCNIRFWVDNASQVIADFVDMFSKLGLEVDTVKLSRPTLDDVMIQYTRRSISA